MVRRLVVAAGTLSLIACATQSADTSKSATQNLDDSVPVTVIDNSRLFNSGHSADDLVAAVRTNLDISSYREARVEEIQSADGSTHLVVQLLAQGFHSVKLARIDVDPSLNASKVTQNYKRLAEDQVNGAAAHTYACPDPTVQFLSWCPNNDSLEISVTNEVGAKAKAAGLKTVILLKTQANHDAVMNYMQCPKLVGNFYDGDANTNEMVVSNGSITADEFTQSVSFNLDTTNIWLACEAYNDPMLTAVQKTAKSQKYAAGINDLAVGPSDHAAACAMEAAITGKPMTQAFQDCYAQLNETTDHWGFGGDGSDFFGKAPGTSSSSSGSSGSSSGGSSGATSSSSSSSGN